MTGYSAVADTSETLLELLRTELTREANQFDVTPDQIVLAPPDEVATEPSVRVSMFMYKLKRDPNLNNQSAVKVGADTYQDPPLALTLQYLLTVYPSADISDPGERMQEQQTIMGRAMQTIYDNSLLDRDQRGNSTGDGPPLSLSLNDERTDDIEQLWNMLVDAPLEPSLVYDVGPVFIESSKSEEVTRVEERQVDMQRHPEADDR